MRKVKAKLTSSFFIIREGIIQNNIRNKNQSKNDKNDQYDIKGTIKKDSRKQ